MTTATYPFAVDDPFQLPRELVQLREHKPVSQVRVSTGDEVFLVTRAEDVRTVLTDQRFSRNIDRPDAACLLPGVRQPSSPFADPPVHTRWRKLVAKTFTARTVDGMREKVADIVKGLLDRVQDDGPPADLMSLLAFPLPIAVVCELLGVDRQDHARFREWASIALSVDGATAEQKGAAFAEMAGCCGDYIATRRADPRDDLLSRLIEVHDTDAGRLSEQELMATVMTLLVGGYENTAHQLGKGLLTLFRHPDQLDRLRSDPAQIGRAVEETLRYSGALDSGFGSPRYATESVEVGGHVIPKGATVLVLRQSANRDPSAFSEPDRFDIDREPQQHYVFGVGPHHCLGASLARLELETAYRLLLHRFPQLQLACEVAEVPWSLRVTAAGPAALPVTW